MKPIDLTYAGNNNPIGQADLSKWRLADGAHAEPTSRVLAGSNDSWAAAEWTERGTYDGLPAVRVYLFSEEEIEKADEASELPWDDEHTARIKLL